MTLRSLSSRIVRGRSGALLVVETDDLTTRAAVCRGSTLHRASVESYCESRATRLGDALDEVLQRLKSQNVRVPSPAVLLSPQVHTVVLQLPVNPKKPLPFLQFQELLRWEVEPYVARRKARRIGAILVGRGYLAQADLERLLSLVEPHDEEKHRRLGDAAIAAGLVTPEQLAECLVLQQSSTVPEGGLVCGWMPLDDAPENGKWRWLVAAMGDTVRQQAVAAFAARGLRLCAAYPLVGGACASLNGHSTQPCAVFEYQAGFLNYVRCAGTRVISTRTVLTQDTGNPLSSCVELLEPQAEQVWLAGRWPDVDAALRELGSCLARPCQRIPFPHAAVPGADATALAGMVGAAMNFLKRAAVRSTVCVPASDPRTPLWRNHWVALGFAAALVACGLFAAARNIHERTAELETVLTAQRSLKQLQTENDRLNAGNAELEKSVAYLKETLPRKQRRVVELLRCLRECCPDEIMIRSINLAEKGDVELRGWGMTPQDIQAFIVGLQKQLCGFTVADSTKPIRQERGWRSMNGYSFEMRLSAGGPVAMEKQP